MTSLAEMFFVTWSLSAHDAGGLFRNVTKESQVGNDIGDERYSLYFPDVQP